MPSRGNAENDALPQPEQQKLREKSQRDGEASEVGDHGHSGFETTGSNSSESTTPFGPLGVGPDSESGASDAELRSLE